MTTEETAATEETQQAEADTSEATAATTSVGTAAKDQPDDEKLAGLKAFGEKLGIDVPDEIMQMGDNAAISAALVDLAVQQGKSEDEIAAALG